MRLELASGIELDVLLDGRSPVVYGKVWDSTVSYSKQTASALTVEGLLSKLAPLAPLEKIAAAAEVLEGILGLPACDDEYEQLRAV
jgi:hypothetical protein